MEFTTVEGVELVSVGMNWHGMNGDVTFTFDHLADAMAAANDDVHVKAPRIKLGHTDPRFNDGEGDHDPFFDADPAFGRVENLRLENDGAVLVGDLVEVPVWLADVMPSAYPNRSIEGAYLDGSWEVKTPGGKTYSFVLTAVALLGIALPAVQDLEDLQRLLAEGPEEDEVEITEGDLAKARVAAASKVTASADTDKIIQTFWTEFAKEDRYWWWVRSIWTDPNELIVDDDEGHLFRLPFASDGEGNVTFGDPTEVRQTFIDVSTNEPVAARRGTPAAVYATRAAAGRTETRPAGAEQEKHMSDKIRERLGLAEDATEEEVLTRLDELDGEETNESEAEGETPEVEAEVEEVEEPVAASDTTVSVDKGVLEDLQRQAQEGAAARAEQLNERREAILGAAVKAGKIAPASKDAWRTKLQAAPDATEQEIEKLPEGLVPTGEELGVAYRNEDAQMDAVMSTFGVKRGEN